MDERMEQEVQQNKSIRGYIIRSLLKGYHYSLLVRQITNALVGASLIVSPDICKHLDYLCEAGYIAFTEQKVTAYTAYRHDAVVKLTKKGVDLAECTIEDAGVDV